MTNGLLHLASLPLNCKPYTYKFRKRPFKVGLGSFKSYILYVIYTQTISLLLIS